jgi:hypothetical protein
MICSIQTSHNAIACARCNNTHKEGVASTNDRVFSWVADDSRFAVAEYDQDDNSNADGGEQCVDCALESKVGDHWQNSTCDRVSIEVRLDLV